MAGWRIGFAVGNQTLISALTRVKSYIDYGAFTPLQAAACAALNGPQDIVEKNRELYHKRRDVLVDAFGRAGWDIPAPPASMFAWAPLPPALKEMGSLEFSKQLLTHADVAVAPGVGYGEDGEGFVRIALVENEQRLRQAARNVKRYLQSMGVNSLGGLIRGPRSAPNGSICHSRRVASPGRKRVALASYAESTGGGTCPFSDGSPSGRTCRRNGTCAAPGWTLVPVRRRAGASICLIDMRRRHVRPVGAAQAGRCGGDSSAACSSASTAARERARLLEAGGGEALPAHVELPELDAARATHRRRAATACRGGARSARSRSTCSTATRAPARGWLALHPREFALLWRLAERPGERVSRAGCCATCGGSSSSPAPTASRSTSRASGPSSPPRGSRAWSRPIRKAAIASPRPAPSAAASTCGFVPSRFPVTRRRKDSTLPTGRRVAGGRREEARDGGSGRGRIGLWHGAARSMSRSSSAACRSRASTSSC